MCTYIHHERARNHMETRAYILPAAQGKLAVCDGLQVLLPMLSPFQAVACIFCLDRQDQNGFPATPSNRHCVNTLHSFLNIFMNLVFALQLLLFSWSSKATVLTTSQVGLKYSIRFHNIKEFLTTLWNGGSRNEAKFCTCHEKESCKNCGGHVLGFLPV